MHGTYHAKAPFLNPFFRAAERTSKTGKTISCGHRFSMRVLLCPISIVCKLSRQGLCRDPRGISPTEFPGEFCRDFFGGFFRAFFLEKKTGGKNPRQFQIRIWEFRGQNPHCKDPALTNWVHCKSQGSGTSTFWRFSGET